MHSVFNAFKRHYRKAKDVFRPMTSTGSFEFQARFTRNEGAVASVLTPDPELTARFVVLVRRFLDRADPLYFETVWHLLEEEFGAVVPGEAQAEYQKLSSALRGAVGIKIVYNGEELTPERIYHLLAEGEYFNRDEEARSFLRNIEQIPFAGQFFWFQFYDYTTGGLCMASLLFDVIQHVEQTDIYRVKYGDPSEATHKCIFCLTTSGRFTSEEHVIPESLGNPEWLLPKGHVCDTCNNGVLAQLDNALANSPLFAYQRIQYLAYDKKGKLPEARIGTTTLKRTSPLNILMRVDPGSDTHKFEEELDDGWVRFSFHETIPQRADERTLARALCKVAMELVAADQGQEYVCGERFNAVRTFIMTGSDFKNSLLIRTVFTFEPRMALYFPAVAEGTLVEIHMYGVVFLLNLEEQPLLELNDSGRKAGFVALPLYGDADWQPFEMHMEPDPALFNAIPEQYRPMPAVSPPMSAAEQDIPDVANTLLDEG